MTGKNICVITRLTRNSSLDRFFPKCKLFIPSANYAFIRYSSNYDRNVSDSAKWTKPTGYPASLSIYNCLTKSKVPLILRRKDFITWYMCGPTVYDSAHLGHACCYVKFDIIRRVLENYFNINVLVGMSITDVDDKIINRSRETKQDFRAIARKYETEFWEDMKNLNVTPPHVALKVTNHIDEIIAFVSRLIDLKKAYVTENGSVYFNAKLYSNYGKLVPISKADEYEKESTHEGKESKIIYQKLSPMDFALWKGNRADDEPGWPSPWGKGRPGWHIECSAMASKLFGSNIDIHSGGIDLMFPHHENEDAQSCSYHEIHQWVNYWIYTGHLYQKGQSKMSKSLKNTLSIQEFLSKYTPNQFRMFCLLSQYHSGVEYTDETMGNAVAVMAKVETFLADANACLNGQKPLSGFNESEVEKVVERVKETIHTSLADDFNTPAAMTALIELIQYTNKVFNPSSKMESPNLTPRTESLALIASISAFVKRSLENLGINFKTNDLLSTSFSQNASDAKHPVVNMKQIIEEAVAFRSEVRALAIDKLRAKAGDDDPKEHWKKVMGFCDTFRQNLSASGVTVKDHGKTSSWIISESESSKK